MYGSACSWARGEIWRASLFCSHVSLSARGLLRAAYSTAAARIHCIGLCFIFHLYIFCGVYCVYFIITAALCVLING